MPRGALAAVLNRPPELGRNCRQLERKVESEGYAWAEIIGKFHARANTVAKICAQRAAIDPMPFPLRPKTIDPNRRVLMLSRLESISGPLPKRAAVFQTTEASFEMDETSDRSTADIQKLPNEYATDIKWLLRQQAAPATSGSRFQGRPISPIF
jgi:hypothetical protein